VKLFNLTDVSTKSLVQNKLVGHTFAVGAALIAPGDSADVPEDLRARLLPEIQKLITLGAIAMNTLPPAYVAAKAGKPRAPLPPEPSTANLRRPKWQEKPPETPSE
jgi:hypothetical protein